MYCVCVEHIFVATHAFVCMCVQKLEVDVCLSELLPTLFTKAGSLTEPRTHTFS